MKRESNFHRMLACASLCLGGITSALAQTAPGSSAPAPVSGVLEEIVVTALRRSEPLQNVPAAITAVSGEQLQESGAQGFGDYLRTIPNVSYIDNSFRRTSFYIRGITDGSSQTDPTTAIYVNEAPISEGLAATADINLFDLDRVEVLRGPQGTLYGASSMGGTIRFILNKPKTDRFEAVTDASLSNTANGATNYDVNGMVNIPVVSDLFALRGVVSYRDNAGFIDDTLRGVNNVNSLKQSSARLSALVTPTNHVTVEFSILFQHDEFGGQADADIGLGPYQQARLAPETSTRNTRLYSLEVNADLGFANLMSATNYFDKANTWGVESTPSFGSFVDPPLTAGQAAMLVSTVGVRSFTQEVRLVSPETQKVTWLVGGFYSNLINDINQHFDPTYAPQLATFDLYTNINGPRRYQIAGFGEIGYSILDNLKATVGVRESQYDMTNTSFGDGVLNGGQSLEQAAAHGSKVTKKFLLSYQATPDNLLYASASTGFRPGGSIDPVPSTCTAELESLGYPANLSQSNPDSLWNYEIGSKNKFLGGRFITNAAVFYIDWSDIQLNRTLDCGFAFTANVGHATSKGVELEAEAEPIPGLIFSGSIGYTNAKLTVAAPGVGAAAGDKIPYVPDLTYKLIAEYTHPIGPDSSAYFRADYQHVADQITNFSLVSNKVDLPAYGIAGLRVGYKSGPWDLALVGTNLNNERAETYYQGSGYKAFVVNRPRTIGVNVRRRF